MKFNEFISGSYTPRSIKAESERLVNFFLERVESDLGKASYSLYRTPGLAAFCTTGIDGFARGAFSLNGHTFWVIGSHVIEIFSDGSLIDVSVQTGVYLVDDGLPVSFAGSTSELMVTSGGYGYVLHFGTMVQITDPGFPSGTAGPCAFLDGYFIVLIKDSQQFQISDLNDAVSWDASNISSVESRPDFCETVWPRGEDLWMFGDQSIQIFYNNGDADFPFVPNQSAVTQTGIAAPYSVAHFGDQLMWLWADDTGKGIVFMADGYIPQRISNHAVESAIQSYSDISDAIGMSFQLNGHLFYRLYFPSANSGRGATWQCDVQMAKDGRALAWSEVTRWNVGTGQEEAHIGRVITTAFGKTLVGSRLNGTVYDMSMDYLDDAGSIIRRERRAPHMYNEAKQIIYNMIGFGGNTGIGLDVATDVLGNDPVSVLTWSNDGGKTWSNERQLRWGKLGEYGILVRTFNLGLGRDRVFRQVFTDPVDWMLTDCYVELQGLKN